VRTRFLLALVGLAIGVAAPHSSASQPIASGTIVFASPRAATFVRPAVYTIGLDGRGRRRVTPTLVGVAAPAWSPSGRWIAFERTGIGTYVVPARGGKPIRIAQRFVTGSPIWSPDSSRLALVAERRDAADLIVVRAGSWRSRRLVRNLFSRPSWSPDGRVIAFVNFTGEVRAVDVVTGRTRLLVAARPPASEVAWSPDARRLAYSHTNPAAGIYEIYMADLSSGRQRRVARGLVEPSWSPDGARIAAKGGAYVYVLNPDGGRPIRVGRDDYDETPKHPPVWSPDGRRLLVANGEVYAVWANGRGRIRVTRESSRFRLPFEDEATWSPDGKRVAYISELRDPGDNDLYSVSATGGKPRALTNNWAEEYAPVWSADGTMVALTRKRGRQPYVAMLRPGGKARLLVRGADPAWSPDGRRLVFTRAGDVYVVSSTGTEARSVTTGAEEDSSPDWSPDGREVVFARRSAAGKDLWAIGVDGSTLRRLTNVQLGRDRCTVVEASDPAWSPDGREVAFSLLEGGSGLCLLRGGVESVHVVSADGSGRTRLVTTGGPRDPLARDGAYSPAWSPDGASIVFVSRIEEQGPDRLAIVPRAGGRFTFLTPPTYAAFDPDWRVS
jgi:Tol biopolymer transport system component